jgi:nucleoside-diphosphate-sugar epimerase
MPSTGHATTAGSGLPQRLLVFGLGYTGRHLATRLRGLGVDCAGTVRNPAMPAPRATTSGASRLYRFADDNTSDPALLQAIRGADAILASIPPDVDGDLAARAFADAIAQAPRLRWLGYLSSTGVYADRGGGVVDAHSRADGDDATAHARLIAESQWRALARRRGASCAVFRLAGLYGPGRNALVQLAQGRARYLDRPGTLFNRVHVEDVCSAIQISIEAPAASAGDATWLLADDLPASPRDVLAHAARLSGRVLPPPLADDDPTISPALQRFYAGSKRIDNRSSKTGLGWTLRHPSYVEGLAAAWAAGDGR